MPDRLFSGLKTAWDADAMVATFLGGLWWGKAPEDTLWPYVVLLDMGNALRFGTSGDEDGQAEFRSHVFQASIFMKEDGANDPVVQVGALMRSFDTFMQANNSTLFSSATEGSIYGVSCTDQRIIAADDDRVWQGQLDYEANRVRKISV
jgi:hypothetical protein